MGDKYDDEFLATTPREGYDPNYVPAPEELAACVEKLARIGQEFIEGVADELIDD